MLMFLECNHIVYKQGPTSRDAVYIYVD